MERSDLASNLEFWSGRTRNGGAGEDPRRRSPSYRRHPPSPRGRARPLAAAALLAGLTAAWLLVGHRSHPSAAPDAPPAPTARTARTAPAPEVTDTSIDTSTTIAARTPDCQGLSPARPEVRCVIDAVEVDARMLTSVTVTSAYERATGTVSPPRSGPPACARGVPDERAWSDAAAPDSAVGRYWCGFESDRAAMWWTRGGRLLHAVGPGRDLAALFSWWRAHPSE